MNATIDVEEPARTATGAPTARLWGGRAMSGLVALFLLIDGVMKLIKPASVVETTVQLGYPESVILGLGIAECRLLGRGRGGTGCR